MTIDFIVWGSLIYFFGLAMAAVVAVIFSGTKKFGNIFSLVNTFGFLIGVTYLINFAGREIALANWDWLFHFSPSLSFLSAIFFTLISGISALVGIYGKRYLELYAESYPTKITQFLIALFVLGMQGVLFANNPFAFLFFWEVMSITSFFLVLVEGTRESARAAFLYFMMTHLGASAILAGFLILGQGSLIFSFSAISSATQNLSAFSVGLAFLLFLFGFGSKASLGNQQKQKQL